MSGNSIGKLFKLTTFGESHGTALGGVIDGCPAGLEICELDIQQELDRRKPGASEFTSQRKEQDKIQIISGVFEGKTTGTPIGLLINNTDQRPKDYTGIKDKFRPGHADFTYFHKYGIHDYRGGGRASARETCMRVAAGAIAKKILKIKCNTEIFGYISQIGDISLDFCDKNFIQKNPFFCANPKKISDIQMLMHKIREEKDSIGSEVKVVAQNVFVGLGQPVFERLDAELAKAIMSINAVKAVAIGDGFNVVRQKGSENNDQLLQNKVFKTNHAGGILGGIASGQDILVTAAFKPTSSIPQSINSVDKKNNLTTISIQGRHDPCVGIRGVPVAESMVALVLVDQYLQKNSQIKNI